MEFDLNDTFNEQFPNIPPSLFEDEIYRWNMENDEPYIGEEIGGSPNLGDNSDGNPIDNEQNTPTHFDGNPIGNEQNTPSHFDGVESDNEEIEDEDGDVHADLADQIERRLSVGSELDTLDMTYLLYCEYAKQTGFSVKKASQKKSAKTGELCAKEYQCSFEGKSHSKKTTERLREYKKQDYRSGCAARLRVILGGEGKWIVSIFNNDHNHELADKEHTYLLRSARHMSHAQISLLEALIAAGIRVKDAYRFMEKESGGRGNVGFIRKDAYHHMEKLRKKSKLQDADSKSIVSHFIEKSNKEPLFYWNIQTDSEGRLMNIFFRDSRSYVDYELFGDVLSVDTTYQTNKYELMCAPFVGVNHHLKNCLFGIGFISDETTETFEWLFETFLDSMNGKQPELVYTDQCKAMMKAINKKFPSATPRLCQWHINRNAPSHFGSLNGDKEFKNKWFHCMKRCESEMEFENTWSGMINNYNLEEHTWFKKMYNLRSRWANVFSKEKFCAGLHATSRSEVTNKVLKQSSDRSSSLFDFVMKYEDIQFEWRQQEGEDDTSCIGTPGLLVENNPLLKHAAKILTRNVFLSFEYEGTHSLNVGILSVTNGQQFELDNDIEYVVECAEDPKLPRRVTYNKFTSEANCSCCLWQTCGVLCRHIFRIFYHHGLKLIPPIYFICRLSKEAKNRRGRGDLTSCQTSLGEENPGEQNPGTDWSFNSLVMRNTYHMVHDFKLNRKMKEHLLSGMDALRDELVGMAGNEGIQPRQGVPGNLRDTAKDPTCRDPILPPKRRHTNTRLSSHWVEPKKPKGKKREPPVKEAARVHVRVRPPRGQRSSSLHFHHGSRASSPSTSQTAFTRRNDLMSNPNVDCDTSHGPMEFYATQ